MLVKAIFLVVCLAVLLCDVRSARSHYQLGKNKATVTTGQHRCKNGRNSEVTLSVEAELHEKSNRRTNFGRSFNKRMKELNSIKGDHKGHILASAFGGPAKNWNLAPQADNLNRKYRCRTSILNVWYDCEKWILDQLKNKVDLPISVKVTLDYEDKNCRPTRWSIEARSKHRSGCEAKHVRNGGLPFGVCQRA
ncbi:hypothetical protein GWI33_001303 [Rhynchophorus ferrugineus]|uniref:Type VII secretion system protein EssD-like domain-containing protein n=1 Tax=Rhynchophorus ferrugineus TaxID=354439 RepID=A0A834MK37_RHYFE|nr:hypothetical protein GWI33_001303 [Rhynchophorus ferrugineus]